jgi:hypothetical protein
MQDAMENTPEQNLEQWAEQGGPPRLKAGLSELFAAAPAMGREVDDRILGAIRNQAAARHRMRWVIRYAIGSLAAAAAVLVIAIKTSHRDQPDVPAPAAAVANAQDVNKDGKLDILDAYLMARKVEKKESLGSELDFNHDGVIDGKDVDVVAFGAVKLKGGDLR